MSALLKALHSGSDDSQSWITGGHSAQLGV